MSGVNHCHSLQFDSRQCLECSENVVYKQSESLCLTLSLHVPVKVTPLTHTPPTDMVCGRNLPVVQMYCMMSAGAQVCLMSYDVCVTSIT